MTGKIAAFVRAVAAFKENPTRAVEEARAKAAKEKEKWPPEQISGRFKKEGISMSHESIYAKNGDGNGSLHDRLS